MHTIPEAVALAFNAYQGKTIRRHPVLPARQYKQNGREINVTDDMLAEMVANLKIRRPVTIAHPDLDKAEAVGWIVPGTAEVSAFGDGKALYVGIEWSKQAEAAITDRKYGFISPVFTQSRTDESGKQVGAALVAAGLTNNPHWSEDQPELWAQFSASVNPANDAGQTYPMEENMEDLKLAKARISELEASLTEMTADRDGLTEKLTEAEKKIADADARVAEFSAGKSAELSELAAKVEKLSGDNKELRKSAWLAEFSNRITPKDMAKDGKPTPLAKALDAGDRETFEFIAGLLPELKNTTPVGSGNADAPNAKTVKEQAAEFAFAANKENPGSYEAVYFAKLEELTKQEG